MRISDWSSDVCSSDLVARALASDIGVSQQLRLGRLAALVASYENSKVGRTLATPLKDDGPVRVVRAYESAKLFRASANNCLSRSLAMARRSEEHTSELQSLMRISYAVFCLKKKNN